MAEGEYLTVRDVAKRLKLSQSAIFNFLRKGNFPQGLKFGASRRWLASDIDEWAQAQTTGQTEKGE